MVDWQGHRVKVQWATAEIKLPLPRSGGRLGRGVGCFNAPSPTLPRFAGEGVKRRPIPHILLAS